MISSPFPQYIGFAVSAKNDSTEFMLSPEEKIIISSRASDKRKLEFFLGRAACYDALKKVGFKFPPPILKGGFNEPIWPDEFVGAITHTDEIAICAVGPYNRTTGIGIDLEYLEGVRREIPRNAYKMICAGPELEWVTSEDGKADFRIKRLFSAKEAAFKAFFPHARSFLDFSDARLSWNDKKRVFNGKLQRPIGKLFPEGYPFEIGSRVIRPYVFSFMHLPGVDNL
ncbi:MAG: 4'-phosphopantetheinyl transferase superfamily protein [Proteobacteria bacterium]|nr:4'-phosphopantetheinyl transferase superfamily protein [Pseudomonadota bacterium]